MKSKQWYIHFPGDAFAMGPIHFEQEVKEREVREYARDWEGIKRLPPGFECWPA